MKHLTKNALISALTLILVGTLSAQTARKLPQGAYLKSAKIEMSYAEANQDTLRCKNAMAILDSLFMYYGPNPEGLSLMSRALWQMMEQTSDLAAKTPWITKFVIFADSLKWACNSATVKEDEKRECQSLIALADSTRSRCWREFYGAGMEQIKAAQLDLARINFQMCIELKPSDTLARSALVKLEEMQK